MLRPVLHARPVSPPRTQTLRPSVRGKFLFVGNKKLYVRGVTYGTFRSDRFDASSGGREDVEHDFATMVANHVNAVRMYDVPPSWVLDAAERHGMWLMVGLPWEQHVAFLEDGERAHDISARVREGVRACAGHPAVLCYSIGNEIPSSIVRWYGPRRVERYLQRLYAAVKSEDPTALVTYVNYPTTEYLQLPFLDFVCFNVYLEAEERLAAYVGRLHNVAGDRPVVMAEIGLDSRRHGETAQAGVLASQLRTVYEAGCAGAFVFAWTDEWHRGGYDITDWDFGLTDRSRRPKPALMAVRRVFQQVPPRLDWPSISVIVCSYNGARTIRDCLEALARLEYPNFDVIVVDDGSTDATAAIASEYDVRLIRTPNRGLSSARNTGLWAARGELIAYIDDDAFPDPHWLHYLATMFVSTDCAGIGGPNLPPPGDGTIADCVANAPGGPTHVLLSDWEAEHIPGCNMAFRRAELLAIRGFDPQFRVAGDDVDLCWRLQQRGLRVGFSPAAIVWHHRRNSVRAYWRQQVGYGKAEALLARKWPQKYNSVGHPSWSGRMYGNGVRRSVPWLRGRIYHGSWGTAPFQSVDQPSLGSLEFVLLMPEWYLIGGFLLLLSALGLLWKPLLWSMAGAAVILAMLGVQAALNAARATFPGAPLPRAARMKRIALTTVLHVLQPLARLSGRMQYGLIPRRRVRVGRLRWAWPISFTLWSEDWRSAADWLRTTERAIQHSGARVIRGGDYDQWDLEIECGMLGRARLRMAIEEHGAGRQMVRMRCWPKSSFLGFAAIVLWGGLAMAALATAGGSGVSLVFGAICLSVIGESVREYAGAAALAGDALRTPQPIQARYTNVDNTGWDDVQRAV